MNTDKIQKYLLKLKDSFLDETEENRRMLDIYVNYIDGKASKKDIEEANYQLKQVLRSLGPVSYTHLTLPTTPYV